MKLKCLKCGCTAAHKNGLMKEHQGYKCKNCGYQYTKTTPRGKPEKDKILALILFLSGLSMRASGKIVGGAMQSVMKWIHQIYSREAWYFKAYGGGNERKSKIL